MTKLLLLPSIALFGLTFGPRALPPDDRATVAKLDTMYQAAVKANDAAAMDKILAWIRGKNAKGEPFDYRVWFSDTDVHAGSGWRYAFGQAGCHL